MNLYEVAKEIREQDNRITSDPIFYVQEKRRGNIRDKWFNVQPFFTEKGAQFFIDCEKRHYEELRIYVASGHNNLEYKLIRNYILNLKIENNKKEKRPKDNRIHWN